MAEWSKGTRMLIKRCDMICISSSIEESSPQVSASRSLNIRTSLTALLAALCHDCLRAKCREETAAGLRSRSNSKLLMSRKVESK